MIFKISPKLLEARDLPQAYRQTIPNRTLISQFVYRDVGCSFHVVSEMDVETPSVSPHSQNFLTWFTFGPSRRNRSRLGVHEFGNWHVSCQHSSLLPITTTTDRYTKRRNARKTCVKKMSESCILRFAININISATVSQFIHRVIVTWFLHSYLCQLLSAIM